MVLPVLSRITGSRSSAPVQVTVTSRPSPASAVTLYQSASRPGLEHTAPVAVDATRGVGASVRAAAGPSSPPAEPVSAASSPVHSANPPTQVPAPPQIGAAAVVQPKSSSHTGLPTGSVYR